MSAVPPLSAAAAFLCEVLPFARRTTVVDVGANPIHAPPYAALLAHGACDVVGFEPQPEAFAELQKVAGPNERYYPFAVGDGRDVSLQIMRAPGLTSILKPFVLGAKLVGRPRWSKVVETRKMRSYALDQIGDLPAFDLLKIDIQGGEGMVLEAAQHVLKEAVAVIIEQRFLRLYQDEPMSGGIDQILRAQGFEFHKFIYVKAMPLLNSQSERLKGQQLMDQAVDGDVVYLRDLTQIEQLSDSQLMHLALLASAVFMSHSLVVLCLDYLAARGVVGMDCPSDYVDRLPAALRV